MSLRRRHLRRTTSGFDLSTTFPASAGIQLRTVPSRFCFSRGVLEYQRRTQSSIFPARTTVPRCAPPQSTLTTSPASPPDATRLPISAPVSVTRAWALPRTMFGHPAIQRRKPRTRPISQAPANGALFHGASTSRESCILLSKGLVRQPPHCMAKGTT